MSQTIQINNTPAIKQTIPVKQVVKHYMPISPKDRTAFSAKSESAEESKQQNNSHKYIIGGAALLITGGLAIKYRHKIPVLKNLFKEQGTEAVKEAKSEKNKNIALLPGIKTEESSPPPTTRDFVPPVEETELSTKETSAKESSKEVSSNAETVAMADIPTQPCASPEPLQPEDAEHSHVVPISAPVAENKEVPTSGTKVVSENKPPQIIDGALLLSQQTVAKLTLKHLELDEQLQKKTGQPFDQLLKLYDSPKEEDIIQLSKLVKADDTHSEEYDLWDRAFTVHKQREFLEQKLIPAIEQGQIGNKPAEAIAKKACTEHPEKNGSNEITHLNKALTKAQAQHKKLKSSDNSK